MAAPSALPTSPSSPSSAGRQQQHISIPPASDRPSASSPHPPLLLHNLKHDCPVLALAVSVHLGRIFVGLSDGQIVVYSLDTFGELHRIQAHKRHVLSLFLSTRSCSTPPPPPPPRDGAPNLLLSSGGDPIINVWCPRTLVRLFEIYGMHDVGDIFSVAHSTQRDTVYLGAQNASIQWAPLGDPRYRVAPDSSLHPDRRNHRFFDSKAVGGSSTPRRNDERWASIPRSQNVVEMDKRACIRLYAHNGTVHCMLVARGPTVLVDADEEVLVSGSEDGTIRVWKLGTVAPNPSDYWKTEGDETVDELVRLGTDDGESVYSLAIDGSFLYSGKKGGLVELWDLDTKQKLRVIKAIDENVMTVQLAWGCLWSAARSGYASRHSTVHYGRYQNSTTARVSQKYQCLSRWKAHQAGRIMGSAAVRHNKDNLYITGANDGGVAVWKLQDEPEQTEEESAKAEGDVILASLGEFVSYKTMSSRPDHAEDCRKGATFLGSLFKKLGGHVEVLGSEEPRNPVILATFNGKLGPPERRKRILFYSHYDVVPADGKKGAWLSDPFQMKGEDGYLYGRGVSDNKGPLMAALYAATDLMQAKALENDVVFLVEGEEESGSRGFVDTVRLNKSRIGHVDYILLANSYWLDDDVPCLTYGLRGVLHVTAEVRSRLPDKHSGVAGSHLVDEPLADLTSVVSRLLGKKNRVMLPGFYDGLVPVTDEEEARYDDIASILLRHNPNNPDTGAPTTAAALKRELMARWREPSLTMHRYRVSGPDGSIIPAVASAHISLRLVPGQEVDDVLASLRVFLQEKFDELDSTNALDIRVDNVAEPWLGDIGNRIFRTLEGAVMEAWADCFDPAAAASSSSSFSSSTGSSPGSSRRGSHHGHGDAHGDAHGRDGRDGDAQNHQSESSKKPIGRQDAQGDIPPKPRKPLYIREGGSIPAIRFLEKEFNAPAAHLPCGQSTDSGHLDNERLRLLNLFKGREIFRMVFERL